MLNLLIVEQITYYNIYLLLKTLKSLFIIRKLIHVYVLVCTLSQKKNNIEKLTDRVNLHFLECIFMLVQLHIFCLFH